MRPGGPVASHYKGTGSCGLSPGLRFIIVGEMHGTAETPAIFADLICSVRENKRPIIVGIELHNQHALDISMACKEWRAQTRELLSTPEWRGRYGRTSTAMLTLLERLRALKGDAVVSEVVAFYS